MRIQLRRVREHEFVEGAEPLDNIKLDLLDYSFFFFNVGYLKSLIGFVTLLFLFYVLIFWPRGVEPVPPTLEGEDLATGLINQGKSLD